MSDIVELLIETTKDEVVMVVDSVTEVVDINVTTSVESLILNLEDKPNTSTDVAVSALEYNRLEKKPDGLFVLDNLVPDPLSYYILSKN